MPELPEVETMRRGILPVVGGVIRDTEFPRSRFKPISIRPSKSVLRRRLLGATIVAVERLGKRILLKLSRDTTVVIEPRMTGLLLLADPPDAEHLRWGCRLDGVAATALWFWDRRGLGTLQCLTDEQLGEQLGPTRLGPDALTVTCEELQQRLRFSRREIKVALLDQKLLAGIGNLYASEILHVAEVHPQKRCDRMNRHQWAAVHRAMVDVLQEAIHYEGSTLSDGTYRNALNRQGSYQNHHRVYARNGQPCPRCRTVTVQRIVQAQRSTFWCPSCQRR